MIPSEAVSTMRYSLLSCHPCNSNHFPRLRAAALPDWRLSRGFYPEPVLPDECVHCGDPHLGECAAGLSLQLADRNVDVAQQANEIHAMHIHIVHLEANLERLRAEFHQLHP